ncbi:MAG TPA: AsmA-like C-terminal region-containing protein [Candidatus Binataceae bacterium]|nr:AsmA-like C-terminal region-containing protein [Candidatus Binataceae bacterium]
MRAVRLLLYAVALLAMVIASAFMLAIRNEDRIAGLILARIHDRTGVDVRVSRTRLGISSKLVVILEHPEIFADGHQVARLTDIRAVLSFSAILRNHGLPVERLVLDQPVILLPPAQVSFLPELSLLDSELVARVQAALAGLTDTVESLDLIDAVVEQDQKTLLRHLDARFYRSTPSDAPATSPWIVNFDASLLPPGLDGVRISGILSLEASAAKLLTGRIWFWDLTLRDLNLGPFKLSSVIDGVCRLALARGGALTGDTSANLPSVALNGDALTRPVNLKDLGLSTTFSISPTQLQLPRLSLMQASQVQIVGNAALNQPFSRDPALSFALSGPTVALDNLALLARSLKGLPSGLTAAMASVASGDVAFDQIAINSPAPLSTLTAATLPRQIEMDATVRDAGYQFPPGSGLPPLHAFNGQVHYSASTLHLSQGYFRLGNSRIEDVTADADLKRAPRVIPYSLRLKAALDLNELYPALAPYARAVNAKLGGAVSGAGGLAPITVAASGALNPSFSWSAVRNYRVALQTTQMTLAVGSPSQTVALTDGNVILTPASAQLNQVRVVPAAARDGLMILNGSILTHLQFHDFAVRMRHFDLAPWSPILGLPKFAIAGPVDGLFQVNSTSRASLPAITGNLTMGAGKLYVGFLRSPIVTRSARGTIYDHSISFKIDEGEFEGSPVTLNLRVPDFQHPSVHVDASVERLDITALTFIHPPWQHNLAPPPVFPIAISGHVDVRQGSVGPLTLTRLSTDFLSDHIQWRVDDLNAELDGGTMRLWLSGIPGPNNWVRALGKVTNIDSAALLHTLKPDEAPPLTGAATATMDLWANTDTDFFSSFRGTFSIRLTNGRIHRWALLSRILGLINLKSWLTASVPDPRLSGLPYNLVSGSFQGIHGVFNTDDLALVGPVLEMASNGNINFGTGQVNLELSVVPALTANWLLRHIPLIGAHLAGGTDNLLAAYFHVTGPYQNPSVIPKPITSVAEFVKKMLGLPLNVIAPNTIK